MNKMKSVLLLLIALLLLVGCSSKPNTDGNDQGGKTVAINDVLAKVKEVYGEDYIPSMPVDEAILIDLYGINKDDIKSFAGELPMMSTHIDTFIAIEANAGKGDAVAAALKAYKENQVTSGIMYPMNMAKLNAAEVVQHGDYVFFVMLGAFDERDQASEEDQLTFAKEQTQKGVEAVNSFFN